MSIGLMLSLLFIVTAFEWKSPYKAIVIEPYHLKDNFDDLIDITITIQQPPKPILPRAVIEVPDEVEIDIEPHIFDVETLQDDKIEELVIAAPIDEEPDIMYDFPEVYAEPIGGMSSFYKFISEHIKYPRRAISTKTEGKVYVSFVVEKDGTITNITLLKGIGAGCDEEAIRVIGLVPKWNPGRQGAHPVKTRMRLPIFFRLN